MEKHPKKGMYLKALALQLLRLASGKSVGQDRLAGWQLRQELSCSFEAEFLLLWETSVFAFQAFS